MQWFIDIFSTNSGIFDLLFKLFAVVISVIYLIYALIVLRQSRLMLMAINEGGGGFIRFTAFLQVLLAVFLIVVSFAII